MTLASGIRAILTEDDDDDVPDPLRVAFAMAFVTALMTLPVFMFLAIYDVVGNGKDFNAMSFGTGAGALIAGIGALIATTGAGLWASSKQAPAPK